MSRDARTSGLTGVGPAAGHGPTMPSQQCLRADEEDPLPAGPRQDPAGRGEEGSLGRAGLGMVDLAAQDGQLLAEHDDLKLLVLRRPQPQQDEGKDAAGQQVEKRGGHQQPFGGDRRAGLYGAAVFLTSQEAKSSQF